MDKNAIKKYAVWARRELIDRVTKRAAVYGITDKSCGDYNADSVNGHLLSESEKRQRQALIRRIKEKGYEPVMEEVAYTWFNRFAALRFMEVNGYLPSHIRVFTDDEGRFRPQILSEAIHMELDGLDMTKVYQLKADNQEEELFKYLLIVQCNALNSILPGMFQRIEDYTELLLPDYLLREGSVIEQMINLIPEENWKDQVQIIGWLYQYYNTEPKDKVFADLKKNIKISKENIPAATQLFTPDWIVHYMVENSLGRLWLEGHPSARDKYLPDHNADGFVCVKEGKWNYYLEEAEQEPAVEAQLAEIRKQYAALKPTEVLAIDPCAGSGHILCVLFDVLVRIYEDYGYTAREAAASIVQNNLWGLDIDDRAAQLAYFAVMMKARQYDRRFFTKEVQPHVYAIQESNGIHRDHLHYLGRGMSDIERNNALNQMNALLDEFIDAKEYGSILQPGAYDWALLSRFVADTTPEQQVTFDESGVEATQAQLRLMIAQGQALAQKYHAVVTNPPYMGGSGMSAKLSDFVKNNYPDSKSDLFAVFMERCRQMAVNNGFQAMITQHSWMFLSSFEKLRTKLLTVDIVNMAHLGARAFEEIGGEVVQTTSFVMRKSHVADYKGEYCRLIEPTTQQGKEDMFLAGENRYAADQSNFSKIPGAPVAYWASDTARAAYQFPNMDQIAQPRHGLATSDNDRFLKLWHEVDAGKASLVQRCDTTKKWFPMSKGGDFRRWYGNLDWVINYENDGKELKDYAISIYRCSSRTIQNTQFYFKIGLTWSALTSGGFSVRLQEEGALFGSGGYCAFAENDILYYILALLNSKVTGAFINYVSPTLNYEVGHIKTIPVVINNEMHETVNALVTTNITLSRQDWDSFETSWDFKEHPLIRWSRCLGDATSIGATIQYYYGRRMPVSCPLELCYLLWQGECNKRFEELKSNEEELNRIFIDIYGLQDELTPDVDDKDVTVRKADLGRDIRSLISYAVGCMVGRYSIYKKGLMFAGGDWSEEPFLQALWDDAGMQYVQAEGNMTPMMDLNPQKVVMPDEDGILPITDDEYFYDDIVTLFVNWVRIVYGEATLEENLKFISDALGGKGSPREVIRNYFLNDFYKDHLKVYQKRPIYWLFDSGKKNGFKALVYMHRYQPDTIARVRTDYVHEMQSRYRTAIADVEQRINGASTSERVKLTKRLTVLQAQAEELRLYEEKIHHLADQMIAIDLDDGVKVNYAKFADVLATIK